MECKQLVTQWFEHWGNGNFIDLPISENFKHTSPFGTIQGKNAYLELVKANRDKFLGYIFEIQDGIYLRDKACVRYVAKQGPDFSLDVSELYYIENGLIAEIAAYYHIGEIKDDRKIDEYS